MKRLKVMYFHEHEFSRGVVLWGSSYRVKDGVFPDKHPCGGALHDGKDFTQYGTAPQLNEFRLRGYWASCYPQGDGICVLGLNKQTPQQVVIDIEEVFNWEVINAGKEVV